MDKLTREVKEFANQAGADLVGIAGQECFNGLPSIRPDQLLPGARSVVVLAMRRNVHLPPASSVTYDNQEQYLGNLAFDMQVVIRLNNYLEDKGYDTRPVSFHGHFTPPRDVIMVEAVSQLSVSSSGEVRGTEAFEKTFWDLLAIMPHKALAVAAGLGTMGRSGMLLTPRFGPRVGLASLITDAPLEPDRPLEAPVCLGDACNRCIEACPSGALAPGEFSVFKCLRQTGGLPPLDMLERGDRDEYVRHYITQRPMVFPFEKSIASIMRTGKTGAGCGRCYAVCPAGENKTRDE